MENNKKKRIISIGIIIFIIIVLVSSGTLAYWSWQTADEQKTEVTLTISQYFSCAADGGGNITAQDAFIAPSSCTNSQHAIKREIKAMPTILGNNPTVNMQLYLDVNLLDSGLSNSQNFRYALTTSSTSCTEGVISSGNFKSKVAGNKVQILDKDYTQTLTDIYYLYIWLDGAETSQSTMNQNFSLSLSGQCQESPNKPRPEKPALDPGMIPVKIANNGTVTTVLEHDTSWYNYDNKEWANVVLVDSDSRSTYKGTTGVTVNQSDILAYYTWIPRYAYKIPEMTCGELDNPTLENYSECFAPYMITNEDKEMLIYLLSDGDDELVAESEYILDELLENGVVTIDSETTKIYDIFSYLEAEGLVINYTSSPFNPNTVISRVIPKQIDISFENKNAPVLTGDAVNTYRTHPAFTFGNENISGIWVGKFEATGDGTTPTVLPNSKPLTNQNVSTQFQTSLKFSGGILSNGIVSFAGNNTYGLTANTDSHMMKNSEWGAVAYLSHSQYGINEEIRINNYYYYDNYPYLKTGCGASEPNGDRTTECQIAYGGATSYPQSTTGNISGVFDMSGGAYENTLGVLSDDNGNPRSGANSANNSGFNGLLNDGSSYTAGIAFPIAKYYDLYTSEEPLTACNGGICYGHALSETSGWYGDDTGFVVLDNPWFSRGGYTGYDVGAGAFNSGRCNGNADVFISWRPVFVAE